MPFFPSATTLSAAIPPRAPGDSALELIFALLLFGGKSSVVSNSPPLLRRLPLVPQRGHLLPYDLPHLVLVLALVLKQTHFPHILSIICTIMCIFHPGLLRLRPPFPLLLLPPCDEPLPHTSEPVHPAAVGGGVVVSDLEIF